MHETVNLLRKALTGRLTSEERSRMDAMMEHEALHNIYTEMEDDEQLARHLHRQMAFSPARGFSRFRQRTEKERTQRLWRRIAVAAACMVVPVMMATVWMLWPGQEPAELVGGSMGNAQVMLTTSDGRKVALEGGSEIKVAEGKVTCTKDGTLAYESQVQEKAGAENELVVPRGGECSVVLEDGTRVTLNAGSKLRYPVRFAQSQTRSVEMEGELYFDVTHDGRPFEAQTSLGTVQVLGTSFCVRAYPKEPVYTTLVSGKVRFASLSGKTANLTPGKQAVASADGTLVVREPEMDEYVGWTRGLLVFEDQCLADVMKTIERWYGVDVAFADPRLRDIRFTGNVSRQEELTKLLDLLQLTGDLTYEFDGKTVTIK